MAVTSVALLSGTLGVVGVTAAHATNSTAFYVAPAGDGGNDNLGANNCTLPAKPCATIEHAINEAAQLAPNAVGSVINLAKGTYSDPADTMFAGLGHGANTGKNNNLTISGSGLKGKKATVVSPQACTSLGTVSSAALVGPSGPGPSPDAGQQAMVVFDSPDGTTTNSINGVTVQNMTLDGAGVAGGACPNYTAGVINTAGEENAVVGTTIEAGTTYGILTDDDANSTIISNVLTPVLCQSTVKGPNKGLNANWSTPANLIVKAFPKCAQFIESGHGNANGIFINGVAYCITTSAAKKNLVITGTPAPGVGCANGGTPVAKGLEIATGNAVIFNTSVAPFTQFGIACNSPLQADNAASETTVCAISDNTVTAGGTVYGDDAGVGPIGIVATNGAEANIDGNSVSDVADVITAANGSTRSDGIGIGLVDGSNGCSAGNSTVGINDSLNVPTGSGNTLGSTSANDTGIQVTGNSSDTCSTGLPSYEVNGNTVSAGNSVGIDLANLGVTATATQGSGGLDNPLSGNSISGVATGAGIETDGIQEQTIGGPLGSEGNSANGGGIGLVLAPCVAAAFDPGSTCVPLAGQPGLGSFVEPSQDNLIQNNTFTGNIAYGVLTVGSYQVNELATQIPTAEASFTASSDNTFNANNWGTATSATNGTLPSEINGAEIEDGTGWGGGCNSETGDCPTPETPLTFAGTNTTFSSSFPGAGPFTLAVCNNNALSEILPVGTEITFNTPNQAVNQGETNDGGTFFVTSDAIITGNNCTTNLGTPYNLSLEAIAPAKVGTLNSPSGQPYILGNGDSLFVDANGTGNPTSTAKNFYGIGAASNSCTPADVNQTLGVATGTSPFPHGAKVTPDVFGATDPPTFPFAYSTTVQARSGGVKK